MSKAKQHHDLPATNFDLPDIELEPLPEINFGDDQDYKPRLELTTAEAVEYIKPLSRSTLWRHCEPVHRGSGQLPNFYSVHDLDRLIDRFTVRPRGRWAKSGGES